MHNRITQWLGRLSIVTIILLASCRSEIAAKISLDNTNPTVTAPSPVVVVQATPTLPATMPAPNPSTVESPQPATPFLEPTPLYTGDLSPSCGLLLPPLPGGNNTPTAPELVPNAEALAALRAAMPQVAWPAMQRLLDAPDSVGLVIYQVGRESEGVYWNADKPMPLASVAKLIILVATVEAISSGEFDRFATVSLAELDRYYLPNFDLGAHRRALAELREEGRILNEAGGDPAVYLDDVIWMMIRHSSNAASDHLQDSLGQERIEATAIALGLDSASGQTAPCNFLGQFLMMANHTRVASADQAALAAYLNSDSGPEDYGRDLAGLFAAYTNLPAFREAEAAWRTTVRRPTIQTQRYFTERLAPQGSPAAYAALMARLARNGLSDPDSSYQARRALEWPMQFPVNQSVFSNLGYKNGSLPGVLTTTYYAYRLGESAPVVIALFYRDLPQQTYRRWRFDLPHDELARWLLAEPSAISLLAAALEPNGR